jgi:hypothetical protein
VGGASPVVRLVLVNDSRCFLEERSEGRVVNRDTGQPFSLDDPCVFRGGTFGADPAAYRAALDAEGRGPR